MSNTRVLKLKSPHMYGNDVKEVQTRLNFLKYNAETVDGYFGPKTDSSVKMFQYANNLVDDCIVGPITWSNLFSSSALPYPGTIFVDTVNGITVTFENQIVRINNDTTLLNLISQSGHQSRQLSTDIINKYYTYYNK